MPKYTTAPSTDDRIKLTVALPASTIDELRTIAETDDRTITSVLRRLIHQEEAFRTLEKGGNKLLIGDKNGKVIKEILRV